VVSTVQHETFRGHKLLLVQPVDASGRPFDPPLLAVDAAQAGIGDYVLVVQEGKSARMVMGSKDAPCEAVIVGVIDYLQFEGRQQRLAPSGEVGK
jgi:ethanolamine utilization protein EutN